MATVVFLIGAERERGRHESVGRAVYNSVHAVHELGKQSAFFRPSRVYCSPFSPYGLVRRESTFKRAATAAADEPPSSPPDTTPPSLVMFFF